MTSTPPGYVYGYWEYDWITGVTVPFQTSYNYKLMKNTPLTFFAVWMMAAQQEECFRDAACHNMYARTSVWLVFGTAVAYIASNHSCAEWITVSNKCVRMYVFFSLWQQLLIFYWRHVSPNFLIGHEVSWKCSLLTAQLGRAARSFQVGSLHS